MTADDIITSLSLPASVLTRNRINRQSIIDNTAPSTSDKRLINDGIEELVLRAMLQPGRVGIPAYKAEEREYLEIAVLALAVRPGFKAQRIAELIHRAIPYPVLLLATQEGRMTLSVAHIRWSQGETGRTVLDGPLYLAAIGEVMPENDLAFVASLAPAAIGARDMFALYSAWLERFEAHRAARITARYTLAGDANAAARRRAALADYERLTQALRELNVRAARETQINRRVELNLEIRRLEGQLATTAREL